jgi:hypothetical protein
MSLKPFMPKKISTYVKKTLKHPSLPMSSATTVILSAAKNPVALFIRLAIFNDASLVKLDSSPSSE